MSQVQILCSLRSVTVLRVALNFGKRGFHVTSTSCCLQTTSRVRLQGLARAGGVRYEAQLLTVWHLRTLHIYVRVSCKQQQLATLGCFLKIFETGSVKCRH